MRRVVITGLGFVTSIGNSRAEVVVSLHTLRSGIGPWKPGPEMESPVKVAGVVRGFDVSSANPNAWTWPAEYLFDRQFTRALPPHGLYAACALEQALTGSGLSGDRVSDAGTGLFCASAGSPRLLRHHLNTLAATDWQRGHPLGVVSSVAGTLNFNLGARYGIRGATCGFVSACTSGSHALGYAHDEIVLGRQQRMLVVAAEDLNAESLLPFHAMNALSLADDPAASRPFDRRRDGFVGAGGTAALILEEETAALERGAEPLARMAGWAQAGDGHHVVQPHPEGAGLQIAMERALAACGVMGRGSLSSRRRDHAGVLLSHGLEKAPPPSLSHPCDRRDARDSLHPPRMATMKLGLIAMSGIRCQNAELLALGLTLPGFLERSQVIASLPSLGLLTLAGMTPPSIAVEYLEVRDLSEVEGLHGDFDAVAISSFSAQIQEAYTLADRFRAAGVLVLLGGLHVTVCPDEAAAHADAIVIGEAEPVWPQVVADLSAGRLQSRYDARGQTFDFREAPMPRYELLDPARYNRLTVQTQRGCPFSCDFCAASIRLNPRFRTKPVAKVIAEIRRIKELWPHPFIEFADDNTFADKVHGRELMRALAPEGVRWFTETDISVARDPELLRLMKESGCAQILIGLESPSAQGLEGVEHRSNWKRKQFDGYRAAIECIQDAGITVNGCFVLGLDHSGTDQFDAVYDFVRETNLYEVQITVMTPFPGTPLYGRLAAEGRLLFPGAWDRCTLFDVNFVPRRMSAGELERGFCELGQRIYDTAFIDQRRRQFFRRQSELRAERAVQRE